MAPMTYMCRSLMGGENLPESNISPAELPCHGGRGPLSNLVPVLCLIFSETSPSREHAYQHIMLSGVFSGGNGLWDEAMFEGFVTGNGCELFRQRSYRDEWEKFPELLLIETKFVAQLHDTLFTLVKNGELQVSHGLLQHATTYLENCVVGFATTASQPVPSEETLKALREGTWRNWYHLQDELHKGEYLPFVCISSPSPLGLFSLMTISRMAPKQSQTNKH